MEEKKDKTKKEKYKIFPNVFSYIIFISHAYNNISNNKKTKKQS